MDRNDRQNLCILLAILVIGLCWFALNRMSEMALRPAVEATSTPEVGQKTVSEPEQDRPLQPEEAPPPQPTSELNAEPIYPPIIELPPIIGTNPVYLPLPPHLRHHHWVIRRVKQDPPPPPFDPCPYPCYPLIPGL